jgi:4-carboxymuconolactone decarboxylase
MNDAGTIQSVLGLRLDPLGPPALHTKERALIQLGALVGADAAPASYQWVVNVALASGATDEEVIGALIAVAPIVGMTRVVAAAPEIAIALGYPIEAALEVIDEHRARKHV